MKSNYLLITIIAFASSFVLSTQILAQPPIKAPHRKNVVKIGLLEPIFSSFGLAYQRFVPEKKLSIQLGGSFTQRKVTIWENLKPSVTGFSVELQARYHYSKKENILAGGIYTGLFVDYSQYKMKLSISQGDINFLDGNSKFAGFVLGYQLCIKSRLYIDGSFGGGYHIADYSGRFSEKGRVLPSLITNGFLPKIDIQIGFSL